MKIFKSQALIGEDSIGLRRARPLSPTKEHTHDYIEIVYVLNGTAIEYVDGTSYEVQHGDLIFMTPNSIHAFNPTENFEHIEIFFSPRLVGGEVATTSHALSLLALTSFDNLRGGESYGLVRLSQTEMHEFEFILGAMQREFEDRKEGYEAFMCNGLNMLLIKMIRASAAPVSDNDVWTAVEEYVDKNFDKKITLTLLASKCFYNPSYFSRTFKQRYGVTLTEYLKMKRIEKAKELLLSDNLTVEDIAHMVGFTDRSAFYSAFYDNAKITPAQYRIQSKK